MRLGVKGDRWGVRKRNIYEISQYKYNIELFVYEIQL